MGQSLLIFGGTIVTMNPKRGVLEDGAIYIEGDRIKAIGNSKDIRREYSADIEINAKGKIVIPGLVNAHTHSAQTLLRGLGDDMNLFEWLTKIIYPIAKNLTPEYVHIGSKVAFMEMVRFGITTVIDNHKDLSSKEAIIRVADAAQEVGIRAVIARGVRDWVPRCEKWEIPRFTVPYTPEEEMKITRELIEMYNGKNELVTIIPGPVATFTSSEDLLVKTNKLALEYNVPWHMHIAETQGSVKACLEDNGKREVEWLYDLGILGPQSQIVHAIWLDEKEINYLAETGAHVIYCPMSNMFLGSGIAPIIKMIEKGINIAIGTDGSASNNNQDLFATMKVGALLQKVHHLQSTIISAEHVFEMATINAAKAMGWEKEIGSIEIGKKADIVIIDTNKPELTPVRNPISSIIYAGVATDVDTVIINGKVVLQNGKLLTVDEDKILEDAKNKIKELYKKAGI